MRMREVWKRRKDRLERVDEGQKRFEQDLEIITMA